MHAMHAVLYVVCMMCDVMCMMCDVYDVTCIMYNQPTDHRSMASKIGDKQAHTCTLRYTLSLTHTHTQSRPIQITHLREVHGF